MTKEMKTIDCCPWCGAELTEFAEFRGTNIGPKPGDGAICVDCAEVSFFDDDLRLRKPSPGQMENTTFDVKDAIETAKSMVLTIQKVIGPVARDG